jgi:hypothetical protein
MKRPFRSRHASALCAAVLALGPAGGVRAADPLERLLQGAARILVRTEGDRSVVYFPAITTDPNVGPTYGPLPVVLWLGDDKAVRHLIATSLTYNRTFGLSGSLRYDFYPDADTKLVVLGFVSQDTEYRGAFRYESRRALGSPWRLHVEIDQQASGSRRFFGFGSRSPERSESVYTLEESQFELRLGRPVSDETFLVGGWSLQRDEIRRSPIEGIPQIDRRLRNARVESGPNLAVVWDRRDVPTTPSRGSLLELAATFPREELGSSSNFVRLSLEANVYLPYQPLGRNPAVFAARLRLEQTRWGEVPLQSQAALGGDSLLRGYGRGRFVDRGLAAATLEERIRAYRLEVLNRVVDFEVAPFFDLGTVFGAIERIGSERIRLVPGIGFRGVVRPTIVGKIDLGFGDEGVAVFTGIDYPF